MSSTVRDPVHSSDKMFLAWLVEQHQLTERNAFEELSRKDVNISNMSSYSDRMSVDVFLAPCWKYDNVL